MLANAELGNMLQSSHLHVHAYPSKGVAHAASVSDAVTPLNCSINPYPTAFPYGNGMVLHFYQQQESSTTKTVHKVINKGLKAYV